jgi:hypothetical protein
MVNMKRQSFSFGAITLLFLNCASAQTSQTFGGTQSLNFPVPDAPAFNILNADPSKVVRPSSVREVTAGISSFGEGSGILPKGFFAEFSPFALCGPGLSLQDYRSNDFQRFEYRARLSIATRVTDSVSHKVYSSVGLRLSFYDGGDSRLDTVFTNNLQKLQLDALAKGLDSNTLTYPDPKDTTHRWKLSGSTLQDLQTAESKLRDAEVASHWNSTRFEGGIAFRYLNPDSLARHISIDAEQAWLAFSLGCGSAFEWILSTSPTMCRGIQSGNLDSLCIDLSSREYFGGSAFRFFTDESLRGDWYTGASNKAMSGGNLVFDLGVETSLGGNLWVDFGLGLNKDVTVGESWKFINTFNIKFGNGQ